MSDFGKPINRAAGSLLSKRLRVETVSEALDSFAMQISGPTFKDALAEVFSGKEFGVEPVVSITISVRKDGDLSGRFAISASTKVHHNIGDKRSLFGLEPK